MSDLHILGNKQSQEGAFATGHNVAEFCKRSDVRHVIALITVDRPDGTVAVVPISSAAPMVDACLMGATLQSIINFIMTQALMAATTPPPDQGKPTDEAK